MLTELPGVVYPFALLMSAAISLLLASYAWRSRHERGAIAFAITALSEAGWAILVILEVLTAEPSIKVVFTNLLFFAYTILPLAWLVMALQYANLDRWLTKNVILFLSVIPIITIVAIWSNPWHRAVYSQVAVVPAEVFTVVSVSYGPWFYVHILFSYMLLLASSGILISCVIQSNTIQRGQASILLAGTLLPTGWSVADVLRLAPFPHFDLTPAVLGVSALIISWGLFRWRLFDIVPVARDKVLQNMPDALVVMDSLSRVVDFNPAAGRLLGLEGFNGIGTTCTQLTQLHPELAILCHTEEQMVVEVTIGQNGEARNYEARSSRLDGYPGRQSGRILLLHDVTERKQTEAALSRASRYDPLTGLYNRSQFDIELRRLERSQAYPIAVVIVDLEELRSVNESAGHLVGDSLLIGLGQILRSAFRRGDIVARIGGDEFGILLPRTDKCGAEEVCRRMETQVEDYNQSPSGPRIEISWGASATEDASQSLEQTLAMAGQNMSRQKLRNRVSNRRHLVDALMAALATKDDVRQGHIVRVSELVIALGTAAGLSREDMADLVLLAEVHDLGKVGIPDSILLKTSPLTPGERQILRNTQLSAPPSLRHRPSWRTLPR